jgi:transposase
MKRLSKPGPQKEVGKDGATTTVGLDLGDRFSHYCVLNEEGDVMEEGRTKSTDVALRRHFSAQPRLRMALECGMHSPWVSRLLQELELKQDRPELTLKETAGAAYRIDLQNLESP